tara:strand:+ start:326 stop:1312 length:987 start_codon:yes stop_codon:yes gene_type:complete
MNKSIEEKFLLANRYFQENKINLAKKDCEDILKDKPNYIQALNLMALIGLKSEDYKLADSYFNKCISIDSKNISIIKNYCISLKKQNKLIEVNKFLLILYELTNGEPDVTYELANNFILINKKDNAFSLVKKALQNYPESTLLNTSMGNILFEMGKHQESEEYYKKAYIKNGNDFQVLFRLGYFSLNNKKYNESISYLEKIINNKERYQNYSQQFYIIYYNIGLAYEKLEEFDHAEKHYLTAFQLNQSDINILVNLSSVYKEKEEFNKSIDFINKAISINTENRVLYSNLAIIYSQIGDHEKSVYYNRLGNGVVIFKSDAESGLFEIF